MTSTDNNAMSSPMARAEEYQSPELMDFDQAIAHLLGFADRALHSLDQPQEQTLPLADCLGKVLAHSIFAPSAVPPAPVSALDGYAVNIDDLDTETETCLPVSLRIAAGHVAPPLPRGTAARIFTGAALPPRANAVIAQEASHLSDERVCFTHRPAAGEDVKTPGSDLEEGQLLLDRGRRLQPQDIALAASAGIDRLTVYRPLKVAVLCSGDELVDPGQPLAPGCIYNANRFLIPAQIEALGMTAVSVDRLADTLSATQKALLAASENADVIITTGGVSVGEEDHIRAAIQSLGSLHIWRIKMRPGKPFTFGRIGPGDTPVLGLPGNPVSAFLNFALLAQPFLLKAQGVVAHQPLSFRLPAGFDWPRPRPHREFLRARIDPSDPLSRVMLYPNQGASALISTTWANGIVVVREQQTIQAGDLIEFIPFSGLS